MTPLVNQFSKNLSPCLGCGKSTLADSIYDEFWKSTDKDMQYLVTKQITVDAETPEEAVAKSNEGKTTSISVQARPAPPRPPGISGMPLKANG